MLNVNICITMIHQFHCYISLTKMFLICPFAFVQMLDRFLPHSWTLIFLSQSICIRKLINLNSFSAPLRHKLKKKKKAFSERQTQDYLLQGPEAILLKYRQGRQHLYLSVSVGGQKPNFSVCLAASHKTTSYGKLADTDGLYSPYLSF